MEGGRDGGKEEGAKAEREGRREWEGGVKMKEEGEGGRKRKKEREGGGSSNSYRTGFLFDLMLSLRTISAFFSEGICSRIFSGMSGDLAAISFAF